MAVPSIDLLPDPPLPTDPEDIFDAKAGASLTAQQAMVPQINITLTWIGQQVSAVDGYRQAAAASAKTATEQAAIATNAGGVAEQQIARAKAYADNAAASALAAESAPGSIGNLAFMHATALSF